MEAAANPSSTNEPEEDQRSAEEQKHQLLIDHTKIMFSNVSDYLKGELQGARKASVESDEFQSLGKISRCWRE